MNKEIKGDWKVGLVEHWRYYLPPVRPCPSDLEFIKKKILEKIEEYNGDKSKIKLLILGSTSEYRNLCGELGIKCYCFDFSKPNFDYLAEEVKNKSKEVCIEGNWLDGIPKSLKKIKENEKFDFILGDCVFNITIIKNHKKLVNTIFKLLKKEGSLIPRTFFKEKKEKITYEEMIEKYRKQGSKKPIFTWLAKDLYLGAFKEGQEFILVKQIWENLVKLHEKELISDDELEELSKLSFEDRDFEFCIPVKDEFDAFFKEKFIIKEVFLTPEQYCCNKLCLHVLKKRIK